MAVATLVPTSGGPPVFPYADKLAHAFLFGVLSYVMFLALEASGARMPQMAAFVAVGYGAFTEVLQRNIPGRCSDVWDFAADVAGALAGLAVAWLRVRAR